MNKRLLSLLLACCFVFSLLPISAMADEAQTTSGTCGENLTWTLENGTLTISGEGEMDNYYSGEGTEEAPWCNNAEAITSVMVENGVTSLGAGAFPRCSNLTSVTLPDSITSIGSSAFWGCSSLTSIVIPNSVTRIDWDAFYGCSSLTSVIIPDGVTHIGDEVFSGCSSLETITIPESVTSIGGWVFGGCSSLISIDVDENNETYCSDNGVLFDKGKTVIIAYPAGMEAKAYRIPDSVKSVGNAAFSGCSSLTSVTIPDGVTSIGDWAFYDCSSLTSVTIPEGVMSLGECAFSGCTGLTSITIPDSVTSIGNYAFDGCYNLTDINYSGTTKQWVDIVIGESNDCLTNCVIHCTDGDVEPLKYCGENVTWTLKDGILTISGEGDMEDYYGYWNDGGTAPWEVDDVTSVVIESGVTGLGNYAFERCGNLTSVTIPESVTSIGEYAFSGCINLSDANYSGTLEQWGSIAISEGNARLTACAIHCTDGDVYPYGSCGENVTWTLENGTLTISGEGSMYNYDDYDTSPWYGKSESIIKLIIEDGITKIGNCAFSECSNLVDVTIPDSVTCIGIAAFSGCTSMTEATYLGTTQQWITIEAHGGNGWLMRSTIRCTNGNVDTIWELSDGVLTISGNDVMPNYGWRDAPWTGDEEAITSIVVEDGATRIGDEAFYGCRNVKSIILPASVTYIGYYGLPSAGEPMEIYYDGTKAQWYKIDIVSGELMINSAIIHCTNGDVLASDYCGNHVKWTLENGVLTISGAGKMYSYEEGQYPPWGSRVDEITSIVIENGVKSIGTYAFVGCKNAKSISIAEGVEKIGYGAFINCDALKNAVLPEGLVTVVGDIFAGCDSLESVTVPSTVTDGVIGWFNNCPKLKNIIIAENNSAYTSVDGVLFNKDKSQILFYPRGRNAESYQIPEGVESIGQYAFENCTALTSITIPDGVTSIGEYAFSGCTGLTSVTLPDGVMEIADKTFENCTDLKSIVIPNSVTSIGLSAFSSCSSLTSVTIGNSVVSIDSWAFENCSSLTSIVIPDSVTYIGNNAFTGCSALESLTLPNSYASVESYAFSGCTSLRTVTIPKTVSFDGNIFSGCTSLEAINVEEGHNDCHSEDGVVYSVDFYSSEANLKIYPSAKQNEKFDIPEWVGCISDYAFDNCSKLKTLTIPGNVSHISNRAFFDCYSLSGFIVSEENPNYSSQDGVLFDKDKTALVVYPLGRECVEYAIPESVSYIGSYAFWNCNNIQAISIPNSVLEIGDGAFAWSNLSYVNYSGTVEQWNEILIGDGNHGIMGAVIHCSDGDIYPNGSYGANLSFELRDGTLTISGTGDVVECYEIPWYGYKHKITNVVIENGVTGIGGMAFYNCMNLQSVTIPDTVTDIGDGAFEGCTSLENVYYGGTAEQWAKIVICSDNDALANAKITFNGTHTHHYTDTVTAPTCTEQGYTTHTCACGESYVDSYVDALGHSFGKWTQTKAPTCIASGTESRSCVNCNATETREVAALDHNFIHHDAKAPTCTENGWEAYDTCSRCDYTTYKEIATLGHDYKDGKCTRCGATDPDYIAAPVIKITTSSGKPKISWSAVDGATKYYIYRSTDGKTYTYLTYTTKTSYTNTKATIGTTYYYKVKAVNANGAESEFSNVKSIKCVPAAPTVTISRSGGKAKLSWKAVTGATKYYIYRSTDGKTYKYQTYTTKLSYTDSKSASGTKYYYKVRAIAVVNNTNVASAYSTAKSITTTLAKPTVKITTSNGKPKLTWSKVTGADKYYIYRSTDGKTFKYYTSTTKLSYTNTGAKKGTKYYYKVKAICSSSTAANSALSTAVSIKATK